MKEKEYPPGAAAPAPFRQGGQGEQEKKTPSDSLTAATSPNGGGKARYLLHYCEACRKKLEGLGYLFQDSERAPVWRSCGLCGSLALIRPAEMFRPARLYRKRTGAGERGRAGRR